MFFRVPRLDEINFAAVFPARADPRKADQGQWLIVKGNAIGGHGIVTGIRAILNGLQHVPAPGRIIHLVIVKNMVPAKVHVCCTAIGAALARWYRATIFVRVYERCPSLPYRFVVDVA